MIQLKEFCGMCRSHSWCGRECRNAPGLPVQVAKAWPAAKKTEPVGIATYEESKARTVAIASGKLKPKKGDPKVWVTPGTVLALLESNKSNRESNSGFDKATYQRDYMRKKRADKKEATK